MKTFSLPGNKKVEERKKALRDVLSKLEADSQLKGSPEITESDVQDAIHFFPDQFTDKNPTSRAGTTTGNLSNMAGPNLTGGDITWTDKGYFGGTVADAHVELDSKDVVEKPVVEGSEAVKGIIDGGYGVFSNKGYFSGDFHDPFDPNGVNISKAVISLLRYKGYTMLEDDGLTGIPEIDFDESGVRIFRMLEIVANDIDNINGSSLLDYLLLQSGRISKHVN